MPSIVALFQEGAFEPEAVQVLSQAYEMACKSLHDRGQPIIVQQIIAERIIAAANLGERDPDRLCEVALKALGNKAVFER